MKKPVTLLFATTFLLLSMNVNAIDKDRYNEIVKHTIQQVLSADNPDIDSLIAKQKELINIAVAGCEEYSSSHPVAQPLLSLVIANANSMQTLSIEQIEEQWHDFGFPESKGIKHDQFDRFGPEIGLTDAVVHPATAIIALREYKKSGDRESLMQVKDELSIAIEHLKHIH